MTGEADPSRGIRASAARDGERFALASRGAEIVLDEEALNIVSSKSWLRAKLVPYREITHFAPTRQGFWLGTTREIMSIRRSRFRDDDGPEQLAQALTRAIARQPYGLEHLTRISQIHSLARSPAPQRMTRLVGLSCVLIYLAQLRDPFIEEVGALVPLLVDAGQIWRLISANFLHGVSLIPLHLLFNLLGLLGLALLVERPLCSLRTGVVMGASGIAAMLSSYAFGEGPVVGASGIVMGLAGAALCLELHNSDRLPVWWRIPRRPFIALLLMEAVSGFLLPFVAGEAHLGGFVAGYATTRLVARRGVMQRPASAWIRRAAWTIAGLTTLALTNVAFLTLRESHALEHYARQLLATPESSINGDNGLAWRMATESNADIAQLEVAQGLAERAANRTDYRDPEVLDTLAEVLFVRGDRDGALRVIDEAIRITRGDDYYLQQRRRFTGERAFDDRPPPPAPWALREPEGDDEDPPGILI